MESRIPSMADSRGKVQKFSRVTVPADRINNLPDSLIFHILAFLPMKDAIATSLLSKSWRFHWTKVDTLDFVLIESQENDPRRMAFVYFVDQVLLRNVVEVLDKFRLEWITTYRRQAIQVNMWLSLVIGRDVRILDLHVNSARYDFLTELSPKVFTCETLECLRLEGPVLVRVPEVVLLPRLEQMDLISVDFYFDRCFDKLISSCPVLHSLRFQKCLTTCQPVLKVSSPSLRFLEIRMPFEEMEVDAPFLDCLKYEDNHVKLSLIERPTSVSRGELSISFCTHSVEECNLIVKMIQDLNSVLSLKLSGSIIKALSAATVKLSTRFERLTQLDVNRDCGDWSSLNVMLECSPNLRVLNITKNKCLQCIHGDCWRDPRKVPVCLLYSLKEISFWNFQGFQHEIAMIGYVFKHGVVMRRINLRTGADDPEEKLQIRKKVTELPRRYPACEILFD